jgi:hypothetical protein
MNNSELKQRLRKDRPMVAISLRIPADVLADLKRVAPTLGFTGYQPLMKAYIGQGLREHLAKLEATDSLHQFAQNLRQRGVDEQVIEAAMVGLVAE